MGRGAIGLAVLLAAALLSACAPTTQVTRGDGGRIDTLRVLDAQARPRIAVAAIVDRTSGRQSLAAAVAATNLRMSEDAAVTPQQLLSGIRDLLTTELFVSDRFIVLERAALDEVLAEQAFTVGAGAELTLPPASLEGADYLVVGAITAIDPGLSGGALPIPVPLGDDSFGLLKLRAARGYIAMDLRVIDARTARVLNATAVEGRHWRMAADFTGFFDVGRDVIKIPGLLRVYQNTPMEAALQRMAIAAVARVANSAQPVQTGAIPGPAIEGEQ